MCARPEELGCWNLEAATHCATVPPLCQEMVEEGKQVSACFSGSWATGPPNRLDLQGATSRARCILARLWLCPDR